MQENDNNNNEKKKTLFAALCFISQLNWGLMQENCFFGTFNTPLHYPLQLQMYDKQTNEHLNSNVPTKFVFIFVVVICRPQWQQSKRSVQPSIHPSIDHLVTATPRLMAAAPKRHRVFNQHQPPPPPQKIGVSWGYWLLFGLQRENQL